MPKIAISPTKTQLPGVTVSKSPVGDMNMNMDMNMDMNMNMNMDMGWGDESIMGSGGGMTNGTSSIGGAGITNGTSSIGNGGIANGSHTITTGGDIILNQPPQLITDPLVLDVKQKNYTLDTEFTFLTMNRMDNTITVTPNATQSYIDGDAGFDTLVLKSTSDEFVLQNDADGNTLVSSVDGSFNIAAIDVDLLKFNDKVIDLNDVDEILTLASDLPAVEQTAPTADSLLVSNWMQNPLSPFPTAQFVDLVFARVFHQDLGNAEAQYWNGFVADYIKQPGQLASLTGLIHDYQDVLFV